MYVCFHATMVKLGSYISNYGLQRLKYFLCSLLNKMSTSSLENVETLQQKGH